MAVDARIRELGNRHQSIDTLIQRELSSPSRDSMKLGELKRQKLRLKEQIEQMRSLVEMTH